MKPQILSLVCLVLAFNRTPHASTGAVYGTVVDEAGRPVEIRVTLVPIGGGLHMLRYPEVDTDASGKFAILELQFGPYFISTGSPQFLNNAFVTHGYVNTFYDFFQARPNPKLLIDAAHPLVSDIKIVVGPKGGTLRGSVSDALTGGSVPETLFRFWRVRNPKAFVAMDPTRRDSWAKQLGVPAGSFEELMPSGIEIGLSITAPGYQVWNYADDVTGENNFTIPPGGTKLIDIKLTPTSPGGRVH